MKLGIHQQQALAFCKKYVGWHTFRNVAKIRRVMESLARKGLIELEGDQFRYIDRPE